MMLGGGMLLGWVFIAAIVVLALWLFRSSSGAGRNPFQTSVPEAHPDSKTPAMRILEERFARGEIDTQEFETRKKELLGHA
jgi:putative membrane protein